MSALFKRNLMVFIVSVTTFASSHSNDAQHLPELKDPYWSLYNHSSSLHITYCYIVKCVIFFLLCNENILPKYVINLLSRRYLKLKKTWANDRRGL